MRQFLRRAAASGAPHGRLQAHKACAAAAVRVSSITALDEQRLAALPVEKTVTFSIVAHVDHGKSSLAQRLLEKYGNLARDGRVSASRRWTRWTPSAARAASPSKRRRRRCLLVIFSSI